ncbi:MAG: SpoIID/LytB domain-containing protein [Candidatus Delongbacteria bacterium]|jgi:stage II sporulation protein D|nr:SpoIID/LytB domain-containing protein [Candidatus Delongbacteria bacterium]
MFIRHYIIMLLFACVATHGISQNMRVALFYQEQADGFVITTQKRGYKLAVGDSVIMQLPSMTNLRIHKTDSLVQVKTDSLEFAGYYIRLVSDSTSGFFINAIHSEKKARVYTGDLEFFNDMAVLHAVNIVPLEAYVAATVEAEGGYNAHPEYYKTQAVLCRTYALRHLHKHEAEGFNLCDGVHCQVYPSKSMDTDIIAATKQTAGNVIIDTSFQLINAVYHSNSGGITANSKDVWSSQLPYLVSVKDTFSLSGKHATWERRITLTEWRIFLENNGVNTSVMKNEDLKHKLKTRIPSIKYGAVSIPVKEIRNYFSLKSAFFDVDVDVDGEHVLLSGKGYGHGVGLSQEGAMNMAENGYPYEEIIAHYYSGTTVVNLKLLDIFRGLDKIH